MSTKPRAIDLANRAPRRAGQAPKRAASHDDRGQRTEFVADYNPSAIDTLAMLVS